MTSRSAKAPAGHSRGLRARQQPASRRHALLSARLAFEACVRYLSTSIRTKRARQISSPAMLGMNGKKATYTPHVSMAMQ